MRPRPRLLPLLLAAAAGWGSACATTGPASPPLSPSLSHDAYVWQRAWTSAVRRAVLAHGPAFRRLLVLAAEVAWPAGDGAPRVARARVDYDALRGAIARSGGELRVGLALRVGPRGRQDGGRDAAPHAAAGRALAALAADVIAQARAAGVQPAELQLDYDAPTSGLAAYARWLRQLRPALRGVPLTVTALPAWLDSPALPRLLEAVDGWVLQVHSLQRPRSPDALPPLTDPGRARAWVARAARLSQPSPHRGPLPLRVALPTYGYEVGFRPDGSFLGLRAEAPLFLRALPGQRWPAGTLVRPLRADAPALSALVRRWARRRAAGHLDALTGIAWYRLPVTTDRLTWRWTTLQAIMQGRPVAAQVRVSLQASAPGLLELIAHNDGLADGVAPPRVEVSPPTGPSPVLFAEALAGYELQLPPRSQGPLTWSLRRLASAAARRLAPGDELVLGWLRVRPDLTPSSFSVQVLPLTRPARALTRPGGSHAL